MLKLKTNLKSVHFLDSLFEQNSLPKSKISDLQWGPVVWDHTKILAAHNKHTNMFCYLWCYVYSCHTPLHPHGSDR